MSEDEKAIERLEDTFYADLGKGINKFQKITLYEGGIQDVRKLLDLYRHKKGRVEELKKELLEEKEKKKELEKEKELNQEAIYLANNTICNYDIGYQDGLNKKMTATEIVAERRKFMILEKKNNQLENANYELHKKIDEGNKKVVEDYISKDKIREKIDYYKKIDNAVGVKILERILEEK